MEVRGRVKSLIYLDIGNLYLYRTSSFGKIGQMYPFCPFNTYKIKEAIEIRENSIVIKIPFNWINVIGNKVEKKKKTNRDKIIEELRNNPNVTNKQLSIIIGILETAIENNIRILRENKIIERIGSKKTGFWKIIE